MGLRLNHIVSVYNSIHDVETNNRYRQTRWVVNSAIIYITIGLQLLQITMTMISRAVVIVYTTPVVIAVTIATRASA